MVSQNWVVLANAIQFRNELFNVILLGCDTQPSITSFYLTPSRQIDMSYPYCYQGPWRHLEPLFSGSMMKKLEKKRRFFVSLPSIGCSTRPMVVFSGILQSPKPPPSGNVRGTVPAHCHGHQFGHHFRCICWLLYVCLLPWGPLGQYGVSSCPMPASSGFRSSPGHAALGNAVCIAPVHRHCHRNGRRTRCICSSLSILSSTITVAKDHVMVN